MMKAFLFLFLFRFRFLETNRFSFSFYKTKRTHFHFRLLPSRGWYSFTDLGVVESWVDLVGWFQTDIAYQSEEGHPSMC